MLREKRALKYCLRRGVLSPLIFLMSAPSTDFWRATRSAEGDFFLAPSAKKALASAFLVLVSLVKVLSETAETSTPARLTYVLVVMV